MKRRTVLAGLGAASFAGSNAHAQASFNPYILQAVEMIAAKRAGGGYDLGSAYTRNLLYGARTIPATPLGKSPATRTMCVAAVAEVMIEAINLYTAKTGDRTPYEALDAATWSRGDLQSLRPYLWMQVDQRNVFRHPPGTVPRSTVNGVTRSALSRGTGHALSIFGLGREIEFRDLQPGDFVNFNRSSGSGHASVFLSYISKGNVHTPTYSPDVRGFQYFSAQGKGRADAGFAYRDAYFGPPPATTAGRVRDGNIIRSDNHLFLCCGRMSAPPWNVAAARRAIRDKISATVPRTAPSRGAEVLRVLGLDAPATFVQFTDEDEG